MRLLFLILAIILLIFTVKALFGRSASHRAERKQRLTGEKVVPCAQCQLHLPRSEALESDGRFFCGEQHRREWLASNAANKTGQ